LTTAAADLGGEFLAVAKRLWDDAVDKKMYATGGLGSRPRVSHKFLHFLLLACLISHPLPLIENRPDYEPMSADADIPD